MQEFSKRVAIKYGLNTAIMFQGIEQCVEQNKPFDDEKYRLFPYMTNKDVTIAFNVLRSNKFLAVDDTMQYILTKKGEKLYKRITKKTKSIQEFSKKMATDYGLVAAIVFQQMGKEFEQNRLQHKEGYHFDKSWVNENKKPLNRSLPYLSNEQILLAIEKLFSRGVIVIDSNTSSFAQPMWYTLTNKGEQFYQESKENYND